MPRLSAGSLPCFPHFALSLSKFNSGSKRHLFPSKSLVTGEIEGESGDRVDSNEAGLENIFRSEAPLVAVNLLLSNTGLTMSGLVVTEEVFVFYPKK